MRNLKLLKSLCNAELSDRRSLGGPLCVAVRSDTDTLLLASQLSIVEFDPRSGQVGRSPVVRSTTLDTCTRESAFSLPFSEYNWNAP